jgi:hypothetical protein
MRIDDLFVRMEKTMMTPYYQVVSRLLSETKYTRMVIISSLSMRSYKPQI